jgi:hypothetical protein
MKNKIKKTKLKNYTFRLNDNLMDGFKKYCKKNKLKQSELVEKILKTISNNWGKKIEREKGWKMKTKNFDTDIKHFKKIEKYLIEKNFKYCEGYEDGPSYEELLFWLIDSYSLKLTKFGRRMLRKKLKELRIDLKF